MSCNSSLLHLGEYGSLPEAGLELMEHDGDGLPLLRGEVVHGRAGGLPLSGLLLGGDDDPLPVLLLSEALWCRSTHCPAV